MSLSQGAVAGGAPARHGDQPWVLSLDYHGSHMATASLVLERDEDAPSRTVVTAASSAFAGAASFSVRNCTNIELPEVGSESVQVTRIVLHPGFDSTTSENDIAVLHLANPLSGGIRMATRDLGDLTGQQATLASWGGRSPHVPPATYLHLVRLPILNGTDDLADVLLAGRNGAGTTEGDAGAPLTITGADGRPYLAGLLARRAGPGGAPSPGIFTRVSSYAQFVDEHHADRY